MKILRLILLGFSFSIIVFAIASGAYKLPGQIAGTVANPLLVDNKFCTDPSSPDQTSCTSFISSVLAQSPSSPYQTVSGDVSIDGKVGIGTAAPGKKLSVNTATNSTDGILAIGTTDSHWIQMFPSLGAGALNGLVNAGDTALLFSNNAVNTGNLVIGPWASGNTGMKITNTGNVGIGTASPGEKLDVSAGNIKLGDSRATSALVIGNFGHKIGREASDGSLYIGGGQAQVVIQNSLSINGVIQRGGTAITTTADLGLYSRGAGNWMRFVTNAAPIRFFSDDGAGTNPNMTIDSNGSISFNKYGAGTLMTNASGVITASSDERLKNITGTFNRGLSSVLGLNPILYQWNKLSGMETEYTYAGFSAQDVKQSIPEAVGVNKDGYLTLSDRPIIAALVNAIKEQQKQISSLLNITDIVNKIGRFIKVETQKLIVSGVDILEKLNSLSQKVEEQQKEIDLLKQQIEALKAR